MASTDIRFSSQVFDLAFHPTSELLFTALLSGDIKVGRLSAMSAGHRRRGVCWSKN